MRDSGHHHHLHLSLETMTTVTHIVITVRNKYAYNNTLVIISLLSLLLYSI